MCTRTPENIGVLALARVARCRVQLYFKTNQAQGRAKDTERAATTRRLRGGHRRDHEEKKPTVGQRDLGNVRRRGGAIG